MTSKTFGDDLAFNIYLEKNDASGAPVSSLAMYSRWALRRWAFCGAGPILGLFYQDGRCFVVSGTQFGELLPSRAFSKIGDVDVAGVQATISSSGDQGDQLFITAGGNGYVYTLSTGDFEQIFDPGFPDYVIAGLFTKGAFAALSGLGSLHISANLDANSWNTLDSGFVSDFSDRIQAFTRTHDRIFMFGSKNTQPMVNQGTGGIAGWVPDGGTIIENGTAAPFACSETDNAPICLMQNADGTAMVMRISGFTFERISNHAVETDLKNAPSLTGAISCSFQVIGHTFYLLYVPGLKWSWLYDLSHGQWVNWGHGDPRYGTSVPLRGVNHAFAFGRHLFGDRLSGAIYELDLTAEEDAL